MRIINNRSCITLRIGVRDPIRDSHNLDEYYTRRCILLRVADLFKDSLTSEIRLHVSTLNESGW